MLLESRLYPYGKRQGGPTFWSFCAARIETMKLVARYGGHPRKALGQQPRYYKAWFRAIKALDRTRSAA